MKMLRELLSDSKVVNHPLYKIVNLPAEKGAVYSVVDAETGSVIENVQIVQKEGHLLVSVDDQLIATIEDFVVDGNPVAAFDGYDFSTLMNNVSAEEMVVETVAEPVWEAAPVEEAVDVVEVVEVSGTGATIVDGGFSWLAAGGIIAGVGGVAAGVSALNGNAA
ncbi:MAG: hypothetical protein HQM07_09400, partial [Zetaproteobacteria bacterium]|nr:hypothetical protein [Zetaproteobacteria bacterium]